MSASHVQKEIQAAFDQLGETLEQAIGGFIKAMSMLIEALQPVGEQVLATLQALPFRFPDETPLDYVLRVGPISGHTIHPDEAWRWEGRDDWWGHTEKDRIADSLFHRGQG